MYKNLLLVISLFISMCHLSCEQKPDEMNKVDSIHKKVLTLDTHADTPMFLERGMDISERNDPWKTGSQVDIPRMEEGGLNGIFFAVYLGQGPRDSASHEAAHEKAMGIFKVVHEIVEKHSDKLSLAYNPEDLAVLADSGKIAIFLGVENGYPIGLDLSKVETYYNLGARYITLSHSANNEICDSSTDPEGPEHGGLSGFGKEVVKEMNRLGMMVDVSHISDSAFYDVIELSTAPVIASHSSVRALCDHPRNLTDDMLIKLAEKGGVMQVNALSSYVKNPPENPERDSVVAALREQYGPYQEMGPEQRDAYRAEYMSIKEKYKNDLATVSDYVDHIDYVVELVGIDYVGIGMDLDGGGGLADCYDISEIKNITSELVKRGYSEEDIAKIWSGNFLRVFKEVQSLSQSGEVSMK